MPTALTIYLGPGSLGHGKNWLRTVLDKGFFVVPRLYGPTEPFFDQSWRPGTSKNRSNVTLRMKSIESSMAAHGNARQIADKILRHLIPEVTSRALACSRLFI
jgi:hypothetical protein